MTIVSLYPSPFATSGTDVSLEAIFEQVKTGAHAVPVQRVRDALASGGKDAANEQKKKLPAFTPGGKFAGRKKSGLVLASGIVGCDFDSLGSNAATVRDAFASDPHCIAAFLSPTGTGVKVFMRCDPTRPYLESWNAVAAHCKATHGLDIDAATKDVSRLCYVSHDPAAFIASAPVTMIPYPPSVAPTAALGLPPSAPVATQLKRADIEELLRAIPPAPAYDPWLRIMSAVGSVLPESEALAVLQAWSPENQEGEYAVKLASPLADIGVGTLIFMAKANGWQPSTAFRSKMSAADLHEVERLAILQKVHPREFGVGVAPEKPVPRFLANGIGFSTPGNLVNVQAQAKSGKSAFIGAMIAAAIVAETGASGRDCLGITAAEPGGLTVLHFDTEQSVYDHHQGIQRALLRAGVASKPDWLRSFSVAGFQPGEIVAAVRALCEQQASAGGLFAVFIDGIADLISSVNEESEANAIVSELHDLAIRYNCAVVVVLHENPAQTTGKGRGHLGSQLERKAETNLRLAKDGDATSVFADKTRAAPISQNHGPRFQWDEIAGMHMSVASGFDSKQEQKRIELREIAQEVLSAPLKYPALRDALVVARGGSASTAERRIAEMRKHGVISKDDHSGYWTLTPL